MFRPKTGEEWLEQLRATGARVLIPQPPRFDRYNIITDLSRPNPGVPLDLETIKGFMNFIADRKDWVEDMARVLELGFVPAHFAAVFPKSFQDDLAEKERNYRGARESEILSTSFFITFRGGQYAIAVTHQVLKRPGT